MDLISKKQLNRLKKSEKEIISEMDMMAYRLISSTPDTDPKNDGDQDDPNDEDRLVLDNPEDFELKKEEDEIVIDKLEPNEITIIPEEEIQEGVINKVKSVPDFEHNVDSWKKKKNRFLFITGVSGSGKTTQAKKLAEEYKANLISLDELGSDFIDSIGQDKIDKMNEIEYSKAVCNYVMGIHKSGQVVIEGVGFLEWFEDIPSLKNQSYIIKGTSYLKSNVQAAKRDKKTAKNFIRDYFKNQQPFTYYSTRADELVKILGGESRVLEPVSETNSATNIKIDNIEKLDYCYKLDDFISGKEHIIFITGVSGSGKSTLGIELETKLNTEPVIELDNFEHGVSSNCPFIKKYMKLHPELSDNFDIHWNNIDGNYFYSEFWKYFEWVMKEIKGSKKQYVLEGVQLLDDEFLKKHYHNLPLIVKNPDLKVANKRLADRKEGGDFPKHTLEMSKKLDKAKDHLIQWHIKIYNKDGSIKDISETLFMDPFLLNTLYASNTIVEPIEAEETETNVDYKEKMQAVVDRKDPEGLLGLEDKYGLDIDTDEKVEVDYEPENPDVGLMDNSEPVNENISEGYYKGLYHLSESDKLSGTIINPRIPSNYMTKNGFEEAKTPRISFSNSIDGALIGLSANLKDKKFYIYQIDTSYSTPKIKQISNKEVPDQSLTGEVWVLNDVKLVLTGAIQVTGSYDKPLSYEYGNNTAETYRWKYKHLSINLNEGVDPFIIATYMKKSTATKVDLVPEDEVEEPVVDIFKDEEPNEEENMEPVKLDDLYNLNEALTAKERKKLKDEDFGIPSLRKYPLHDPAHVYAAIKFFNYIDKEHEKELAKNIIKAANKFDIPIEPGEKNKLRKYVKVTLKKKQAPPKKDDVYNVATSETFELSRIDEAGQFKTAIGDPHIKNVPTVVVNDKDFVPFYVVLTSNDTHIAKVIKTVTKEPYNHASFSTDPNLKILYSFARRPDGKGGFVIESTKQGKLFEYMHAKNPTEYAMFVTFISMEKFEKIKERLNNMIDNIDAYKYKFMQLIRLPLGIKNNDNNAMICSEFVGNMLKEADKSLVIKHPSLLTPYELINPKFHFVSSGLLKEYKPVFTKKKVAEILKSENISQFITENVSLVSKLLYDGSLSLLKPYTQKVFDTFFPYTDVYPENLFSMTIGGLGLHMPFTAETDFDDLFLQYNSAVNKFAAIEDDDEHNRFALYIQNIYYSLFIRTDLNLLNSIDMDTLKVLDSWLDRVKLYYSKMLQKGLSEEDINSYKQKLLDIMWYYKEDPNSSEIVEFRKIKLAATLGLTASAITDSHIEYDEIFRNYIDISNIQDDVFLTMDKRYPVFSPYDLMRSAAYFSYLEDFDKDYFVEQWCKKYLFYGCKFKLTSDMQIADYVKSTLPDIINDDADILNSNAVLDVNIEGVSAGNVVVSLDDDGNLLIKKKLDADMNTVYRRALRNIKIYKDTNNLDALKYEVALLDYMAQLIEVSYITPKVNKLYKNDKEYAEKRKEMLDLRAIIINSYSQSLKFILEKEPTFNYREYYNTTPFSKDIKLTKNEILTTVRLTKEVVKLITGL